MPHFLNNQQNETPAIAALIIDPKRKGLSQAFETIPSLDGYQKRRFTLLG